ncbi:cytochrome b/b6 domain-containing protein [Thioclava sp.]|uniref:cytochrome b/b6 domain-containing protein n=1 Tax=Thioclava sp. TaxID=1933450 RepID=UPI003AA8CAB2
MKPATTPAIKVWDPFVRVFHWSLVLAFLAAYFIEPEDSTLAVHVWAGYAVGGLIVLRIIWGFVGSLHARFSDFLFGPLTAFRYLLSLFGGRSKRYLGHSPAGAWMVFGLLIALLITVLSGMSVYAQDENKGPLAPLFASSGDMLSGISFVAPASADVGEESDDDGGMRGEGAQNELFKDLHEVAADLTLILALLHIGGVFLASVVHKENLVRSMVTGRKRPE